MPCWGDPNGGDSIFESTYMQDWNNEKNLENWNQAQLSQTKLNVDGNYYEKHLMNIYLVKKKLLIGMQTNDVKPTTKFINDALMCYSTT